VVTEVGALGKHLALVGFMGAGKTTIGREVARLTERPFVDTDGEIERRFGPIPQLFEERGEGEFRRLEEDVVVDALASREPAIVALGGGAVLSERTREGLRRAAFTAWLQVDEALAWERASGSERPLAQSREAFASLYEERLGTYDRVADAAVREGEDVLLRALAVFVAPGRLARPLSFGSAPVALVLDGGVPEDRRPRVENVVSTQVLPGGEESKALGAVRRLWSDLRVGRDGGLVAVGGGATTDVAGFVAATYMRGLRWTAIPTTLVGQVDAAIGGKVAIDLPEGKNLVGAFHFPSFVIVDPAVLETLPAEERRQGMAEVVKTGLLAGEPFWELPEGEMVRSCAAFKCAVVLSDPYERGRRAILNLGHTFGHALEAASDFAVRHGDAVALGLLAALRLSGQPTDVVEEVLRPQPVRVDRERAWAALGRDKKSAGGRTRLVLLERPGEPVHGVELPDAEVRAALDSLIAT
jgi:shikimate kinase / 3-dehydroquinate synthase